VTAGEACGVCATFTPVGGGCKAPQECTPGSTCVGDKCTAFGDVDATCASHAECFGDLACLAAGFGSKCAPALGLGDSCEPAQGGCAPYTGCGPSKTCEALAQAKLGNACGALTGGFTFCGYPGACEVTDPTTNTGTCVPLVDLDGKCSFDGPYQSECQFPGRCILGSCTLASLDACSP
jgi:hypothetical protein